MKYNITIIKAKNNNIFFIIITILLFYCLHDYHYDNHDYHNNHNNNNFSIEENQIEQNKDELIELVKKFISLYGDLIANIDEFNIVYSQETIPNMVNINLSNYLYPLNDDIENKELISQRYKKCFDKNSRLRIEIEDKYNKSKKQIEESKSVKRSNIIEEKDMGNYFNTIYNIVDNAEFYKKIADIIKDIKYHTFEYNILINNNYTYAPKVKNFHDRYSGVFFHEFKKNRKYPLEGPLNQHEELYHTAVFYHAKLKNYKEIAECYCSIADLRYMISPDLRFHGQTAYYYALSNTYYELYNTKQNSKINELSNELSNENMNKKILSSIQKAYGPSPTAYIYYKKKIDEDFSKLIQKKRIF